MARPKLTSNERSFRKNPRNFLNKITEAPIEITINDGVNPEYTVTYDTNSGAVTDSDAPPGTSIGVVRKRVGTTENED